MIPVRYALCVCGDQACSSARDDGALRAVGAICAVRVFLALVFNPLASPAFRAEEPSARRGRWNRTTCAPLVFRRPSCCRSASQLEPPSLLGPCWPSRRILVAPVREIEPTLLGETSVGPVPVGVPLSVFAGVPPVVLKPICDAANATVTDLASGAAFLSL